METPTPVDMASWPRRELFEHYRRRPCTHSMTVELDTTELAEALRRSSRKTYVAQIWSLASIVNRHEEFRMCLMESGLPGIWPVVHPAFTVFNAQRETFSDVWSPFDSNFHVFHDAAAPLLTEHARATAFFPQGAPPKNSFDVSSVPWVSFTGFNLNLRDAWDHLAPILTLGRHVEREGRLRLPLAIQANHAVIDGFHVARFVNELQQLIADPSWV